MSLLKNIQSRRKRIKELDKEREEQIIKSKHYKSFGDKKKVALIIIAIDVISILIFLWFLFYVLKI